MLFLKIHWVFGEMETWVITALLLKEKFPDSKIIVFGKHQENLNLFSFAYEIYRIHDAYLAIKGGTGYHKNRPDKILVFNQPLPSGTTVSLGTTKSSIAKIWVGVGALKPDKDTYKMVVLSPKQLEETSCKWEDANIGLTGKNFAKIRIIDTR